MRCAEFMRKKFDPQLIPAFPDLSIEQEIRSGVVHYIAGIDEVGRGPLAGPVFAAAVILPPDPLACTPLLGLRDSKQLSPASREHWATKIKEIALSWGIGSASAAEIDTIGIVPATQLAARRALESLLIDPEQLILDYMRIPGLEIPQISLVKGDQRSLTIAASSILAKTARDAECFELDQTYPGYGFAHNKGYGTPGHLAALIRLGPCPIHRYTFKPISQLIRQDKQLLM